MLALIIRALVFPLDNRRGSSYQVAINGGNMATKTVGIKDFKNQATQLLRHVREDRAEIIVTLDGEPIAVLRPFHTEDNAKNRAERLKEAMGKADKLAAKIAKTWTSGRTAAEAVDEQRR